MKTEFDKRKHRNVDNEVDRWWTFCFVYLCLQFKTEFQWSWKDGKTAAVKTRNILNAINSLWSSLPQSAIQKLYLQQICAVIQVKILPVLSEKSAT